MKKQYFRANFAFNTDGYNIGIADFSKKWEKLVPNYFEDLGKRGYLLLLFKFYFV